MEMTNVRLAIVAAAAITMAAAGVFASPMASGTANAANTYTISYINRCAVPVSSPSTTDCLQIGAHSTYSQSQVWINGSVFCNPYSGSVRVTWCGVGGGNGTGALNIGANFNMSNATGLYERMDMFAGGAGCETWGSNSGGNAIIDWFNADNTPICEQPA
jgi:hypothetical protein